MLPDGSASRPFYVKEHLPGRWSIRKAEQDGLGDEGFSLAPRKMGGWTCERHAQDFCDILNDRYRLDP